MSLAIPYVLDAAADVRPDAMVDVGAGRLGIGELNRRTIVRAERGVDDGYAPGDRVALPSPADPGGLVDALAALRIAPVLCDDPTAVDSPSSPSPRPERDVVESGLWSARPAVLVAGRMVTHGELIDAAAAGSTQGSSPLQTVIRARLGAELSEACSRCSRHGSCSDRPCVVPCSPSDRSAGPADVAVRKNARAKTVRFAALGAICRVLDRQPGDVLCGEGAESERKDRPRPTSAEVGRFPAQ